MKTTTASKTSLEATLGRMASLLEGRASVASTAKALDVPPAALSLYVAMAEKARTSLLDGMFPHCRHAIVRSLGVLRWDAIVHAYFARRPETHFARHRNAREFPIHLRDDTDLPAWLAELADFEWREWEVAIAEPDDPRSNDALTSTLILRRYAHDVVAWIDEHDRAGDPEHMPITCAFWQDRRGDAFRNALSDAQIVALARPGHLRRAPRSRDRDRPRASTAKLAAWASLEKKPHAQEIDRGQHALPEEMRHVGRLPRLGRELGRDRVREGRRHRDLKTDVDPDRHAPAPRRQVPDTRVDEPRVGADDLGHVAETCGKGERRRARQVLPARREPDEETVLEREHAHVAFDRIERHVDARHARLRQEAVLDAERDDLRDLHHSFDGERPREPDAADRADAKLIERVLVVLGGRFVLRGRVRRRLARATLRCGLRGRGESE
jgi:hypothetical protein